jgi:hypothetical protein
MKNPPGRPPLAAKDETVRTGFALTATLWDQVVRTADKKKITVSEFIRLAIIAYLRR